MPRCKYCHSEISKFDSDICPHCGEKNPIDCDYRTIDITQTIDRQSGDFKLYKSKSKKLTLVLSALLGPFGADDFYLGFTNRALLALSLTLMAVGGIGTALFLLDFIGVWIYFAIYGVIWLLQLIKTIILANNDSLKDARGEFLR